MNESRIRSGSAEPRESTRASSLQSRWRASRRLLGVLRPPAGFAGGLRQAIEDESILLVESTSNQVNQFGGYTGMTPGPSPNSFGTSHARSDFPSSGSCWAATIWVPTRGAANSADSAMAKARRPGSAATWWPGSGRFTCDTSMKCGDDPGGPDGPLGRNQDREGGPPLRGRRRGVARAARRLSTACLCDRYGSADSRRRTG